ncbi:hypothetical protein EJD97_019014 [Solanum chilense]|uniref:Myosin motor domain-containing protein n=1 Tax=Solanum chilense TaxID=4083 RepID=A0A6N2CD86_SOLCI|nr:hypothetical protein EJD97_019014 [Solanum chilense]
MLNSNFPKVFVVARLDATVERPNEDDIGTAYNEFQLFHGISQTDMTDMSWSLTLDAILEHRRIIHPAISLAIAVPSLWSLLDFPASLAEDNYSPLVHNSRTCYFSKPLTVFIDDALVSAPYHHVVLKIHREGIAQASSDVIAGQTGKILRRQITFEMVIVFDLGGCTFDVPNLEDMDGVLAEISKGINTLAIAVLANGAVTIKDNSNSIFLGGQCDSGKTESTTMLKHYVAYLGGLKSMEKAVQNIVLDSNPILDE